MYTKCPIITCPAEKITLACYACLFFLKVGNLKPQNGHQNKILAVMKKGKKRKHEEEMEVLYYIIFYVMFIPPFLPKIVAKNKILAGTRKEKMYL